MAIPLIPAITSGASGLFKLLLAAQGADWLANDMGGGDFIAKNIYNLTRSPDQLSANDLNQLDADNASDVYDTALTGHNNAVTDYHENYDTNFFGEDTLKKSSGVDEALNYMNFIDETREGDAKLSMNLLSMASQFAPESSARDGVVVADNATMSNVDRVNLKNRLLNR